MSIPARAMIDKLPRFAPCRVRQAVDDAGNDAIQWFHPRGNYLTHGVVVSGGMIRVMGVDTLHPGSRSGHTAGRRRVRPRRHAGVTVGRISAMGGGEPVAELGVRSGVALHRSHSPAPLEAAHPNTGQRAGQPEAGRKRGAVVEDGRDVGDDRQPQMTPGHDGGICSERSTDLCFQIVTIGHSSTRSRPVTKSQTCERNGTAPLSSAGTEDGKSVVAGTSSSITTYAASPGRT